MCNYTLAGFAYMHKAGYAAFYGCSISHLRGWQHVLTGCLVIRHTLCVTIVDCPFTLCISFAQDRSFTFILKTPPASVLLAKAAGVPKGSGAPNTQKVGKITQAQLKVRGPLWLEWLQSVCYATRSPTHSQIATGDASVCSGLRVSVA